MPLIPKSRCGELMSPERTSIPNPVSICCPPQRMTMSAPVVMTTKNGHSGSV
jgi:hypothetical protein